MHELSDFCVASIPVVNGVGVSAEGEFLLDALAQWPPVSARSATQCCSSGWLCPRLTIGAAMDSGVLQTWLTCCHPANRAVIAR